MVAVATYIELRSPFKFFKLAKYALGIRRQLSSIEGVQLKTRGIWTKHYTLTLWEDESKIRDFAQSGAHLKSMKIAANIAKEIRTCRIPATEMPSWVEAKSALQSTKPIRY